MENGSTPTLLYHLADPAATETLGQVLALASPVQAVLYLHGDLGAGKTTLTRGFLGALGHRGAVKSPTYTLIEPYQFGDNAAYHLDLYRLGDAEELEYLGLRDLLSTTARWLVEWPERGLGALPAADIGVLLRYAGHARRAELSAYSASGWEIAQRVQHALAVR